MLVSRSLTAECLGAPLLMVLLCLNCASAACSCGRLAWLLDFVNDAEGAEDAADQAQKPVFAAIDSAATERSDASPDLEALFVLKPRDD